MEMHGSSDVSFSGLLEIDDGLSLLHHVLILDTHKTTTVVFGECHVFVVSCHESLLESVEVLHVFFLDIGQGNARSSLKVNKLSKVSFTFDDAVSDTLLLAESWQEAHKLDWLNITGNSDKFGLTFLDEGGHVIQTVLKVIWLWSNMICLVSTFSGLGFSLESILLDALGFWLVLVEELHELGLLILLNGLGEDIENWWALKSHEQHSLLSLDSHILWPLNISGQVSCWLDVSTDSHVSWRFLEQGGTSG